MSEHPWTDPRPGDTCTNGRVERTVTRVVYRGGAGGQTHLARLPGDWVDSVVYRVQGRQRSCAGSTWADWCRAAIKAGGRYLRMAEVRDA